MKGRGIAALLLALGVLLGTIGIAQGQAKQVRSRAERICLECVGFD